jgi:hypothetical protein
VFEEVVELDVRLALSLASSVIVCFSDDVSTEMLLPADEADARSPF